MTTAMTIIITRKTGFRACLPAVTRAEAAVEAEAFAKRVLGENETVEFEVSELPYNQSSYSFMEILSF